jgi:hypothetical protein
MDLGKFKNVHPGETGVVIGNGPSLKIADVSALSRKYPTFGSNQIFRLPFTPTYYSIVDKEMLDTCTPLPYDFTPTKFIRAGNYFIEGNNPIYPIVAGGFSKDIDSFVVLGGTVTYALFQIAYYMGFQTLLLLGVDHNYPMAGRMKPGRAFVGEEYDPDHFQPSDGLPYFRFGKTYNAPELERVEQYYKWADEFFKLEGRRIVNLTPNSKTDAFEKMSIEEWLTAH